MSDEALLKFKKLYLEQDFHEAKKWLSENQDKFDQGVYHYNLGTLEAKKEDFAQARFHFELAHKWGISSNALSKNLNFTKNELGINNFEKAINWKDYWYKAGLGISIDFVWSFFFLLLSIALLGKYFKELRKIFVLSLIVLGITPLLLKYFYFNQFHYVVSLGHGVIYEGPSKVFSVSTEAPKGAKLLVKDQKEGWLEVLAPVKAVGWIEKKQFKSVSLP